MPNDRDAAVERVARIIELAIMRHGVPEGALEGTLDDAEEVLAALPAQSERDEVVEGLPQIAYWRGLPLRDVPRDELEREFCAAHEELVRLRTQLCENSIEHVRDLAAMHRR